MNIKKLILGCVAVFTMVSLAGCGNSNPTPEEVAKKIDNKETLTQADYSTIFDYCGDYAKKAQQYFDEINNQPNDSTAEYIRATSDMAALYADYPYLDMFRTVVYNLQSSALDEKNNAKVEEYAKYQAFPIPEGEGADLTNPDVVGDIVEMPESDTSGVIAGGGGEAVDMKVK